MPRHIIKLEHAFQEYPTKHGSQNQIILNDINLKITPGEFVTIVGPTGCGKSTLMRLILGSEQPSQGQALMYGKSIEGPNRDRGIVLQQYGLYDHMTVRENVLLGLELEEFNLITGAIKIFYRKKKREFRKMADEYLKRVGLLEHADKYPRQLSGGMRQRVAIAQAMIMHPKVLMMDEPFGALDAGTREEMQIFTLEQWQRKKTTVIFVTHDLEEAIFMGTRLIVLSYYYSNEDGSKGIGSRIVKDIEIPWLHPRTTEIKHAEEFNQLMSDIRREGLDPEFLQKIKTFDLRHKDALEGLNTLN